MSAVVNQHVTPAGSIRHLQLDALRGFAILIVIIHHVGLRFPAAESTAVGRFLVTIGWGGVELFFAISGFLITRILLAIEGRNGIRGFFIKRFFRIVPLYVVALAVFLVAAITFGQDLGVIERLWMNALFLTAWVIPFVGENGVPYTITWSVSVEETAYLLFGALALLGARTLRGALPWIVVSAVLVRLVLILAGVLPESAYYFAPGRLDAIALGGIAAVAAGQGRTAPHQAVPLLVVVTMVVLGMLSARSRHDPYVAVFGYTLVGIFAACLVGALSTGKVGRENVLVKQLAKLGLVSYFVYLFHGFAIAAMHTVLAKTAQKNVPLELLSMFAVLLSYGPAVISWKYFELPLIKLGRRLAES